MTPSLSLYPLSTPCGQLVLGAFGDELCFCDWAESRHHVRNLQRLRQAFGAQEEIGLSPVIEEASRQLKAYFNRQLSTFDLPLRLFGTPFQESVWRELTRVPYGKTISYGELATRVGHPTAYRAVANANGANRISIIIPCHRVIERGGGLGGYAGGLPAKRFLLQLER